MKKCIICCEEKELIQFGNKKTSKDGKNTKCKKCCSIYNKKYRQLNGDKILEKESKYRDKIDKKTRKEYDYEYRRKNHKKILEREAKYREENREKYREYDKNYYLLNKEKIKKNNNLYAKNNREKVNYRHNNRKKNDIIYRLSCNIRNYINRSINGRNYTKKSKTYEIVGCSADFLKGFLEAKFLNWMNWDNHGKYNGELDYGWDIDHIIPLSSAKTEEDLYKLLHYTNLQPLCSKINRDVKRANLI